MSAPTAPPPTPGSPVAAGDTGTDPDTPLATSTTPRPSAGHDRPWTQRTVDALTDRLSRKKMGRRSFLTRAALVGSALAVDPLGFVLRPQSAWAAVCGDANECDEGWSAFCATINDGANTCPSGSYPAGWWKIDNTTFCSGRARYIVDCNVRPGTSMTCRCAQGECDRRRVACNNFRYGQCNTQVAGTTPVVCRIVLCTPPWEWGNCNRTSLTSNQTRTHWSARLPSRTNPTAIMVRWLEMGLTGSILGDLVGSERSTDDGGRWARFDNGVMTKRPDTTNTRYVTGPHGAEYASLDGPDGNLRYPYDDIRDNPPKVDYQGGATYRLSSSSAVGLWTHVQAEYEDQGGPSGWMGMPDSRHRIDGEFEWVRTDSEWYAVWSNVERQRRVLRTVGNLPDNGRWPALASTRRWSGGNRYETAVEVSRRAYPDGADAVLVVRADDYPDATAAGAVSARIGAPILLTTRGALPRATRDEIVRLGPARAIVLGGSSAVSGTVDGDLRDLGVQVERWKGSNRYATAIDVSRNVFPDGANWAVVAAGTDFPDSLTIAPEAHRLGAPVLMVQPRQAPRIVLDEIQRLGVSNVLVVGGTGAVRDSVLDTIAGLGVDVSRVRGGNRYSTSAAIARRLGGDADEVVISTGTDFPDGLAISAWANARRIPILLVNDSGIDPDVDAELLRRRPRRITVVGGTKAVSDRRRDQLGGYPR